MEQHNSAYIKLQKHLDKQAVGFPATRSGAELNVLKHIFTPQEAEFICSCCGCCCGMLSVHKRLPKPLDFWASNYFATVSRGTCVGCGVCARRCQVGAVKLSGKNQAVVIDLNRCIGCGVCIPACPSQSLSLEKKPTEVKPPQTREELHDIIAAARTGRFGKLKLIGKLIVDSVRTGNFELLK